MKIAKLFKNGQSQAVRLPKEFRFQGEEVFVRKLGNTLVLIPKDNPWQTLVDSLNEFSSDFMKNRDQPSHQKKRKYF